MKTSAARHNCCFLSLAAWLAASLLAPAMAFAEMRAIPVPAAVVYAGDQIVQGILVDRQFSVPDAAAKNYVLLRRQVEGLYAK
ncbi:MAG: hypothetical protein WBB16_04230, partial [Aestuariivirga sp.]